MMVTMVPFMMMVLEMDFPLLATQEATMAHASTVGSKGKSHPCRLYILNIYS
jgi:hypothetical protein